MIDITSFLLKHLYEFMADNYSANQPQPRNDQQQASSSSRQQTQSEQQLESLASESQQIVSFLINNQLPDLACETLIELIFICVFLAISWILVMIVQLHCHQTSPHSIVDISWSDASSSSTSQTSSSSYLYARDYYCNTKFLNSLMYCNNHNSFAVSS